MGGGGGLILGGGDPGASGLVFQRIGRTIFTQLGFRV